MRDELATLVSGDLRSPDAESKAEFLRHFHAEELVFTTSTTAALAQWAEYFEGLEESNEPGKVVGAVAFTAINHNISSFKLFMSGYIVASGSLFRQVLEGVSLALLCSTKSLSVLDRFMKDKYSTKNAVADLAKQARVVGVKPEAVRTLQAAYTFYHRYSHLSKLTIAAGANFSLGGVPNVGAYFDPSKLPEYRKEVKGRVSLAKVLPNIVSIIVRNSSG